MTQRVFNALSATQKKFGAEYATDFGGWTIASGAGNIVKFAGPTFYNTYIPGSSYRDTYAAPCIAVVPSSTDDLVIESPFVDVASENFYISSAFVASLTASKEVTLSMDFYESSAGSATASTVSRTIEFSLANSGATAFQVFKAPAGSTTAKLKFTYSGLGSGSLVANTDTLVIYDPFVCHDNFFEAGNLSYASYKDLPNFMLLDDKNISDLVAEQLLSFPLKRFMESLWRSADAVSEEAKLYEYTRPTEGTESKSKLTDPDTAAASYLGWLASVTGTNLLISASGFSPWAALEAFEADPSAGDPGEWEDLETLDWLGLENVDPDFFDTVQSFRDQIRTGFSGINGGRPDAIAEFLQTLVGADSFTPVVKNDRDNPFHVEILIDPDSDPGGTLISDAANNGLSAGARAEKVTNVVDSGNGSLDFSTIVYPASNSNTNATGAHVYDQNFVADPDGYARNLRLNENSSTTIPELGGGVGNAHYTATSAYFYGDTGSSTYGSITSGTSSLLNLGGVTTGYDIIVVLTDLTLPTASADTAGSGGNTPADWLYREKRLIACGTDNSGSDNDWAIYLVSGSTQASDNETRLMLIDGYEAVGATNYAVSSAIDFNAISSRGDVVLRVSKAAGSGAQTVSFYAQSSLYDDWESHAVGTASITSDSATAGSGAKIQILGQLNATDNWADANPLSCSVKRLMFFNAPISFSGTSDTSSGAHAYFDGGSTTNFGYYVYSPTVDIDLSAVTVYSASFNTTVPAASPITMTVNNASSNDLDILAFRDTGDDDWYFGHAASGGDTLTIDGLGNSTAYDVVTRVVNTTTGGASNKVNSVTTNSSGVLTITPATVYDSVTSNTFSGITLKQIAIQASGTGPSGTNLAKFLPTTIGTGATTGADSITASNTWTLTRNFPASSVAYAPSQLINKNFLHAYEGSPSLNNCPKLEIHKDFSVLLQVRRFWTASAGTDYDIFKIEDTSGKGLKIFYDGPAIKATFKDGTNTETVSWTESPTFGSWHWIVVRRDPTNGLSLVVNGTEQATATATVDVTFALPTTLAKFSEGAASEFNARFGLAEYVFFDRKLTDAEITLLNSQIT